MWVGVQTPEWVILTASWWNPHGLPVDQSMWSGLKVDWQDSWISLIWSPANWLINLLIFLGVLITRKSMAGAIWFHCSLPTCNELIWINRIGGAANFSIDGLSLQTSSPALKSILRDHVPATTKDNIIENAANWLLPFTSGSYIEEASITTYNDEFLNINLMWMTQRDKIPNKSFKFSHRWITLVQRHNYIIHPFSQYVGLHLSVSDFAYCVGLQCVVVQVWCGWVCHVWNFPKTAMFHTMIITCMWTEEVLLGAW